LLGGVVDWLDEVVVEPGFAGLLPIILVTPAGQGRQHHVLSPRLFAYPASHFEAIHLRQTISMSTTSGRSAAALSSASAPSNAV
jgi:hypothetical protein